VREDDASGLQPACCLTEALDSIRPDLQADEGAGRSGEGGPRGRMVKKATPQDADPAAAAQYTAMGPGMSVEMLTFQLPMSFKSETT